MKNLIKFGLLSFLIFTLNISGFSQINLSDKLNEFVAEDYYENLTKTFEFYDEVTQSMPTSRQFTYIHFQTASFPDIYEIIFFSGPIEKGDAALKSLAKRLEATDVKSLEKEEFDATDTDQILEYLKSKIYPTRVISVYVEEGEYAVTVNQLVFSEE